MGEDGHKKRKTKITSAESARHIGYALLLFLSFILGRFFASSSCSSSSDSNPNIHNQLTTLQNQLDQFGQFTTQCSDPVPPELVRRTILDRVFQSTSPYENFPSEYVGDLLSPSRVKGWGSQAAVFEHLIKRVRPKTIIEIGTFLGASAIHMLNLTRQLGIDSQIVCVDDFRGWPGFRDKFKEIAMINGDVLLMQQFMQNVVSAGGSDSIIPVPFSTGGALDKLCEWGVFGDLIEVDAGHDFNSAWLDINRAYRILRSGGVLFGHDYFNGADNRGVRRAVHLFAQLHDLKVIADGQHWIMGSVLIN
ncbi:hypothetical protein UlMin_021781 [Ulmus minor]